MKELFLSWGMLILSVVFNACGAFIIKWRLNQLGPMTLNDIHTTFNYLFMLLKSPIVAIGIILFLLAPILFTIALSRMDIVVAYPVQIGLNFLILIILALLFLEEQITLVKSLGILLIFAGVVILHRWR